MTDTTKLYRKATVSRAEATAGLFKNMPNADLVSFERKTATAAEAAHTPGAQAGDTIYVATIRTAEFPPSDDGGGEEESAPEPKEKKKSPPSEEGGSDDGGESSDDGGEDAAPEFGSDADGPGGPGEGHPHKLPPAEETNHLLTQILHAIQGGDPLGGPPGGDPMGGPDLPDVGAPPAGEGLPPGGPTKAPLPPPVAPHSPAMPGGAFSSVTAGAKEFQFTRIDVKADGLGHRALIAEAHELAPGYRVAKLTANEAEDTATLTMIREQ